MKNREIEKIPKIWKWKSVYSIHQYSSRRIGSIYKKEIEVLIFTSFDYGWQEYFIGSKDDEWLPEPQLI